MKRISNLNPRELRRGNGDGRLLTVDDWFGLKEGDWTASSTSGGEKAAEDRSFNGEDGWIEGKSLLFYLDRSAKSDFNQLKIWIVLLNKGCQYLCKLHFHPQIFTIYAFAPKRFSKILTYSNKSETIVWFRWNFKIGWKNKIISLEA